MHTLLSVRLPRIALMLTILTALLSLSLFSLAVVAEEDTIAPVLSSVAIVPAERSAIVTWTTNEPSDSSVDFGASYLYGTTVTAPQLVTQHSVILSGLEPGTAYHYVIRSKDAAGNTGTGMMFATSVTPQPPVQTGPYERKHSITAYGSSSTQGNQDATGMTYWSRIASSTTAGGTVITNRGAGGATDVTILAQATGAAAAQKAADAVIQYGGNAFNRAGDAERHFSAFQNHLATIGHTNFLAWVSHNASSEAFGTPTWVRSRKLIRDITAAHPGKAVDLSYVYRFAPPLDATDTADQARDVFPTSYRFDASHLNKKGYTYGSDQVFTPWVEARSGGVPFIAPYQKIWSAQQTAQTSGGFVATVPFIGGGPLGENDLTGTSISETDPDFSAAIVGNEIRLSRESGAFIKEDRRLLPLTLTKGSDSRTFPVLVSIGDLDSAPQQVTLDGKVWMVNDTPFKNVSNGKKLTIVFDWEAVSGDGTEQYLLSTGDGLGIVVRRVSTNVIRVFVRDANNTAVTVASLTSTQQLKTTDGRRWVFFSIDTTPGVQVAKLVVDDAPAITSTPAANATLNLSLPGMSRIFTGTDAGATAVKSKVSMVWIADEYMDVGLPAVRELFRSAATKAANDLGPAGVVQGIAPYVFIRGTAGDFFTGKNFGTGGDLLWVDQGRAN